MNIKIICIHVSY